MVLLQETNLLMHINHCETRLDGFVKYRSVRKGRSCGGMSSYVREGWGVTVNETCLNDYIEIVALGLQEQEIMLVNMYRVPGTKMVHTDQALCWLNDLMEKHSQGYNVILAGDLWTEVERYELRR